MCQNNQEEEYAIITYLDIYDSETEEVIDEVPIYDDGSEYSEWFKKEVLHISNNDGQNEEKR